MAAEHGAKVESFGENRGLGAAVRRGLELGGELGAVTVVFADADDEYDPAELERLVAPILAGTADYVVGSRFAGGERRMRPHRELGNRVLTRAVRWATGLPVTDGQSGYRALSADAAAAAEVIHDYNYAQVLTIDLVGKGFRYAEVPISYRYRTTGRSFVRLGPYLRRVGPGLRPPAPPQPPQATTVSTGFSPRRRSRGRRLGRRPRRPGRTSRRTAARRRRTSPSRARGGCCRARTGPAGRS